MPKFLKILRFCAVLFYSTHVAAQSQIMTSSVYPVAQCPNASSTYSINAGLFVQLSGASYYQWTITSNNNCITTFTTGQHGGMMNVANTGSQIAITVTCCGQYTAVVLPFTQGGVPLTMYSNTHTFEVVCPYSPTVVASASAACEGQSITVTELGGNAPGNYNWFVNGNQLTTTSSSITLTPSVNTCITFSPNSVQGCTNALISAACVSVQSSQLTLGNLSYTLCNNVPLCLTLPPQTLTNVLAGTSTPSITWLAANNSTLASPCMTGAIPGTYTAFVSHTGAAGTCTRTSMVSITTSTALSVSVSPSVISVCNSTVSIPLSAASIQSVSNSYTWSIPNGSLASSTQTGSTIFGTANFLSGTTNIYTVNASYFGCAGSNTVAIKPFIINPTLFAAADSICLGSSVSLSTSITAGQIGNYAINFSGFGNISTNNAAPGTATVLPSFLPASFTVTIDSANCSATSSVSLHKKILRPKLLISNDTVCRGTAVSMTCQNVGYSISNSYSFGTISPITGSIPNGSPTFSFSYHTPSVTTVYHVVVDSAGCNNIGSTAANATVFVKPKLQVIPNVSSATVCPGTALNLSASLASALPWPVTYSWTQASGFGVFAGTTNSPSVQVYPSTPSIYSVNVSNPNGCGGDTSINVFLDYNLGFPMFLSASEDFLCEPKTIVLNSIVTASIVGYPLTYSWSPGTSSLSGMTTQSISVTPTVSTIYTLVTTNQNGCRSQNTINITVDACLEIEEALHDKTNVIFAPNPVSNFITISIPQKGRLTIYSHNSSIVFTKQLESEESVIDISIFPSGIYLFEVGFENTKVHKKIIVQ